MKFMKFQVFPPPLGVPLGWLWHPGARANLRVPPGVVEIPEISVISWNPMLLKPPVVSPWGSSLPLGETTTPRGNYYPLGETTTPRGNCFSGGNDPRAARIKCRYLHHIDSGRAPGDPPKSMGPSPRRRRGLRPVVSLWGPPKLMPKRQGGVQPLGVVVYP